MSSPLASSQLITRRRAVAVVSAGLSAVALSEALAPLARAASPVDGLVEQAQTLSDALSQLVDAVLASDSATLASCTQTVLDTVDAMRASLGEGIWSVASFVPVVGGDVTKARELLAQADDLADNALAPLSAALQEYPLSSLIVNGAVNGAAIERYSEVVAAVQPVFERVTEGIEAIGSFTVSQLNEALEQIKGPLGTVSRALTSYKGIIENLPDLIGCNGARTYLVIAQNNAEIRATGGFPGAWGTVVADNGEVTMGGFGTIAGRRDVVFDLTDEEIAVFGTGMSVNPASLNSTPDFPRAAELLASAWLAYVGQSVDGVVAMDPVFLQSVLALTGGVTASDGTVVDGTNAAQALLSDVYWRYGNDGTGQDAFFAGVAGLAADQIMNGFSNISFTDLFDVLRDAANEGRLLVWSAHEDIQSGLSGSDLAGEVSDDAANPVLGVYVNDDTWGKMCWYLLMDTQVTGSVENANGTTTYDVTTTYANTITLEEAWSAPTYVTGSSPSKRSTDDMYIKPLLVAPAGGAITDVVRDDGGSFTEGVLYGHGVWVAGMNLEAQERVAVSYKVTVPADATARLKVRQTPTAQKAPAGE